MTERARTAVGTLLLTFFAAAIAGFHPYAEDGGLYVAGVKKLLHPELFPAQTAFVTEHLRFSLFAPLLATIVRATALSLPWVLILLYVLGIWATLLAAWSLTAQTTRSRPARWGAVALLACWLTLPIAGTSLILMDPYVTARTFSTPFVLAALACATHRRWIWCGLALLAAALMHPLMAAYGLAAVIILLVERWWLPPVLALATAAAIQAFAPPESAAYAQVVHTRYYWFLSQWQWYEWLGLAGPILVLLALSRRRPLDRLSRVAILLAAIATTVALLFARESMATHLVARLQPLRCFQLVYVIMILLLGAWLGERLLQTSPWRWVVLLGTLGAIMAFTQRDIYAHSAHWELPSAIPRNAWQQAFLWARDKTPINAVFALDAHYITQGPGEDAQCFRAMAERSALPDYSKDGGEASITPSLTAAWSAGQAAQTGLETMSDADRLQHLRPLAATWVILQTPSPTHWSCPYSNAVVKVCQLP